ncbi:MAG: hypothetical protein ACREXT_17790, partial [Gammaproteobacteria bacterium]
MDGIRLDFCETIRIGSDAQSFTGNVISGNTLAGLRLRQGTNAVTLEHNIIGTDAAGTQRLPNDSAGIVVEPPGPPAGKSFLIGGANAALNGGAPGDLHKGNLISGNGGPGIMMEAPTGGASAIRGINIEGNLIGVNLMGTAALKNAGGGIFIHGGKATQIVIGHQTDASRVNLISGNGMNGIDIDEAANWKIWGNTIGLSLDRSSKVGNEANGVSLSRCKHGEIGSNQSPYNGGNVISGNQQAGIHLTQETGGASLIISHNRFGTNSYGTMALGNQWGVRIAGPLGSGPDVLAIGGDNRGVSEPNPSAFEAGNLISGNDRDGILIDGSANAIGGLKIFGNRIGVDQTGRMALPNMETGIRITGEFAAFIGIGDKDSAPRANVISGNMTEGVRINSKAHNVTVANNQIGCGADEKDEIPNQSHGVWILGGANLNLFEANRIFYNKMNGIRISDAETRQNKLDSNSIH